MSGSFPTNFQERSNSSQAKCALLETQNPITNLNLHPKSSKTKINKFTEQGKFENLVTDRNLVKGK